MEGMEGGEAVSRTAYLGERTLVAGLVQWRVDGHCGVLLAASAQISPKLERD